MIKNNLPCYSITNKDRIKKTYLNNKKDLFKLKEASSRKKNFFNSAITLLKFKRAYK